MSLFCFYHRRLIEKAFVEETLPESKAAGLYRHLKHCPNCKSYYNELINMERLVDSKGETTSRPSSLEFSLWAPLIIEERQSDKEATYGWAWGYGAAVAALVLVIMITVIWSPTLKDDDQTGFTARNVERADFALRVFCELHDVEGKPLIRSLAKQPTAQEVSACPADGHVFFATSQKEAGYLHGLARFPDGGLTWLTPAERGNKPAWLEKTDDLSSLKIKLDPFFAGDFGYLDMIFVLGPSSDLRQAIESQLQEGVSLDNLKLPKGSRVVVRRIPFENGRK
jgi:hypothetical protein